MRQKSIAIVQNVYPHYRNNLFDFSGVTADLFVQRNNSLYLRGFEKRKYTYLDVCKYEKILVPMELKNLLTWYLLLTRPGKTYLIGQGTNPSKNYLKILYGLQILMARSAVIYCKEEYNHWRRYLKNTRLYLLNNTLDIKTNEKLPLKSDLRRS